jgi:hypothetical protein
LFQQDASFVVVVSGCDSFYQIEQFTPRRLGPSKLFRSRMD